MKFRRKGFRDPRYHTKTLFFRPPIVSPQCIKLLPLLLSSNIKGQPAAIGSQGEREMKRKRIEKQERKSESEREREREIDTKNQKKERKKREMSEE